MSGYWQVKTDANVRTNKIFYLNNLYKRCKYVFGYNITFKRIDGIIKGGKE